jgi:hypothetical protein
LISCGKKDYNEGMRTFERVVFTLVIFLVIGSQIQAGAGRVTETMRERLLFNQSSKPMQKSADAKRPLATGKFPGERQEAGQTGTEETSKPLANHHGLAYAAGLFLVFVAVMGGYLKRKRVLAEAEEEEW